MVVDTGWRAIRMRRKKTWLETGHRQRGFDAVSMLHTSFVSDGWYPHNPSTFNYTAFTAPQGSARRGHEGRVLRMTLVAL